MNELQNQARIRDPMREPETLFEEFTPETKLPIRAPTTSLYVCNTDPNHKPAGEHWVTIYIDSDRRGEYFDSFGMPPLFNEFLSFFEL